MKKKFYVELNCSPDFGEKELSSKITHTIYVEDITDKIQHLYGRKRIYKIIKSNLGANFAKQFSKDELDDISKKLLLRASQERESLNYALDGKEIWSMINSIIFDNYFDYIKRFGHGRSGI